MCICITIYCIYNNTQCFMHRPAHAYIVTTIYTGRDYSISQSQSLVCVVVASSSTSCLARRSVSQSRVDVDDRMIQSIAMMATWPAEGFFSLLFNSRKEWSAKCNDSSDFPSWFSYLAVALLLSSAFFSFTVSDSNTACCFNWNILNVVYVAIIYT